MRIEDYVMVGVGDRVGIGRGLVCARVGAWVRVWARARARARARVGAGPKLGLGLGSGARPRVGAIGASRPKESPAASVVKFCPSRSLALAFGLGLRLGLRLGLGV